jgi:hypothetical protein
MSDDPIVQLVKQGLAQGFRTDDLLVVLADEKSDQGQRLLQQGLQSVGGTVVAVIPKNNFHPAFPDAPAGVADGLRDKPAAGTVHAVQIDDHGHWALGDYPVK